MFSIQQCAMLACLLDVTIPKPGNVHRSADFADMSFWDFVKSAVAIAPIMEIAPARGLGQSIHDAIRATRDVTSANTNLGIVLLMAPLAKTSPSTNRRAEISRVLSQLDGTDAQLVYQAIRLAQPGGLGRVREMDIADTAPDDLLDAMRSAAERDLIARQYSTGFALLLDELVPEVAERCDHLGLTYGVIGAYLKHLSSHPDSLIARKCGPAIAQQVSDRAMHVLRADVSSAEFQHRLADFDFWLRSDGNRRNPGTTADLITAALFVCLLDGQLDARSPIDFTSRVTSCPPNPTESI